MAIPADKLSELEKAGYRFIGNNRHSAVKICRWTRNSLLGRGVCYKEQFYSKNLGVRSHRCLQLAPGLPFCDHRCIFCWRNTDVTGGGWAGGVDEPAEILDAAVSAQRLLLSGFGGNPNVDRKKFKEAQNPKHCAISLAGEPTLYPKIDELIEECRGRGMTSFLVTNGLHPEVLENMVEPTQLYVSLVAPDQETYEKVCHPTVTEGWEMLNRSLELLPSFKCRKVVRLTLVKGLNMKDSEGYAKLIEKTGCDFVECKAYMWVGYSRARLRMENMPLQKDIRDFSQKLSLETGYAVADESEPSRAVLLKKA